MPKKEINVTGILIDAEDEKFKFYQVDEDWTYNDSGHSSAPTSGSCSAEGLENILALLALNESSNAQFVIMYDVSCPKKEELIKKLLSEIKKKDSPVTLVSIGHEESPLSKAITEQLAKSREIAKVSSPDRLLKAVVDKEVLEIKKGILFSVNLEKKREAFTEQLQIISQKAQKLRKDKHITAADAADALHRSLTDLSETYFSHPSEEAYITFRRESKKAIQKGHEELDKHRGWKRVLGNFGLAILGFGLLYGIAVAINGGLFFNKTDSAEKLDSLEILIDNNAYQMG
ncbi:effector protein B, substrate of the Dot/Icm secretion system [Legionella birminghamensis]|uniref:Effector protein B, substrate of the Dot/Icm secretion system n=1 Tax=Legionella birminghamensis TaxID=28083 RepID=A0A378IDN1_9GAMM|nr:hypothetical protein [Legionella birminghamensis]KTC75365.1 effector protein B, substrate of the Dot/Icm secretion system [Legionella birminghamensis]STX33133.1 LepB protein [Legionella birminghamensis]